MRDRLGGNSLRASGSIRRLVVMMASERTQKVLEWISEIEKRPDLDEFYEGTLVIFKSDEWAQKNIEDPRDDPNDYIIETIIGIPNDGGDP